MSASIPASGHDGSPGRTAPAALAFGVLGDSDSHSYADSVSFAPGSDRRGGAYRATTLQWTEVLARLRPAHLDPGAWGVWGERYGTVARLRERIGLPGRVPRKEDFRYNFAMSGARCDELSGGRMRQAPRLAALIRSEPGRWLDGVVVVRIGVNSFGQAEHLERLARDPADPALGDTIRSCIEAVRSAHRTLREAEPTLRIVLVGIFDNTHWARHLDRFRDPAGLANVAAALDRFDAALRAVADTDPRTAFFDDRAWFASTWGGRAPSGAPAYRTVDFGEGVRVTNTEGDHPRHATLADGHAGTAWNVLWADALIALLERRFGMPVPRLGAGEMRALVGPQGPSGFR